MTDWQSHADNINYLLKKQKDEYETSYDLLKQRLYAAERDRDEYERLWKSHKLCYERKCGDYIKLEKENIELRQDTIELTEGTGKKYTESQLLVHILMVIVLGMCCYYQ
jgi:hypothetical protein